jgi:ATP-dependent protease Clp ATPase subunit
MAKILTKTAVALLKKIQKHVEEEVKLHTDGLAVAKKELALVKKDIAYAKTGEKELRAIFELYKNTPGHRPHFSEP